RALGKHHPGCELLKPRVKIMPSTIEARITRTIMPKTFIANRLRKVSSALFCRFSCNVSMVDEFTLLKIRINWMLFHSTH
ncbi:MAG TPA: hypothetical protein VK806_13675, partial [Bacteroidia bacterium]|nr:hypothetical protein [Bacteroidia bacterium]